MKWIKIIGLSLFLGFSLNGFSQEIRNIRVTQAGTRINILFDLAGEATASKIDLYYTTDDGINWTGPLKFISGDVSNLNSPAQNLLVIWDAQAEKGSIEGTIQFKIETNISRVTSNKPINLAFKKHKTLKTIWLTTGLVSSGIGIYSVIEANKLYDDYKVAETEAANIHKKIEAYDIVAPVAFGLSGVSVLNFFIQAGKQSKAKKQVSLQPMYLPNGGGAMLTLKF